MPSFEETLARMKGLYTYGKELNESSNLKTHTLEHHAVAADGVTYGIIRENSKYYIKSAQKGKETIADVMSPVEEIMTIGEDEPARNVVIAASNQKLISIPIINDENQVIGVTRSVDIVDSMSSLYDIKVSKIYKAMEKELRGVSWDELMEASAKISTRTTGVKITPEEYEKNIQDATFGEAIWATGGLEKFFAGLISVGELVIARKVGRARR